MKLRQSKGIWPTGERQRRARYTLEWSTQFAADFAHPRTARVPAVGLRRSMYAGGNQSRRRADLSVYSKAFGFLRTSLCGVFLRRMRQHLPDPWRAASCLARAPSKSCWRPLPPLRSFVIATRAAPPVSSLTARLHGLVARFGRYEHSLANLRRDGRIAAPDEARRYPQ